MSFEYPAGAKGKSTEAFLLACPDVGTRNRGGDTSKLLAGRHQNMEPDSCLVTHLQTVPDNVDNPPMETKTSHIL